MSVHVCRSFALYFTHRDADELKFVGQQPDGRKPSSDGGGKV
jgi:hypothetical protein